MKTMFEIFAFIGITFMLLVFVVAYGSYAESKKWSRLYGRGERDE